MCRIASRAMKHLSYHQEIRKQWYLRKKTNSTSLSVWVEWPQLTLCFSIKLLWCVYMIKWHNQLMWVPCDWDDHTAITSQFSIVGHSGYSIHLLWCVCMSKSLNQLMQVPCGWDDHTAIWVALNITVFDGIYWSVLLYIVVTLSTCFVLYPCCSNHLLWCV